MRPFSHQLLAFLPAALALLLVLLSAVPMGGGGISMTPNIAWLMRLMQDMLFGTPLGSQALLALLLAQLVGVQEQRQQVQLFRLRWLEAAGMLVLWHVALWAIMHAVQAGAPSLRHLLQAGLANALWYPCFYWVVTRAFAALPDAK
jgi:cell shape-determining protein MreD